MKQNSTAPLTRFSEDEAMIKEAAADFANKIIAPHVAEMDREAALKPDIIDAFFSQGFMGIEIPESLGGAGGNFMMAILAIEEVAKVDGSASVFMDVQNTLVNNAIINFGSDAVRSKYLPGLAEFRVGAYALSEASSGSDAFALKTKATKKGDYYLLNGTKMWTTNGAEADIFLVFANVNPEIGHHGITAFIVEKGTDGLKIGKKEEKMGIRASSTTELVLEDCPVPGQNILGDVGKGYKVAIETLNEGRIGIGAQMVGIASGALAHAISYSKERKQFGKSIASFQAVQFELADLATRLESARLMVYQAARKKMAGDPFIKEAAMAKYYASEVAEKVTSGAMEIFGGYGYVKEYPVEKYFRDAKIGKIYEGTSNMQLQTIARALLK